MNDRGSYSKWTEIGNYGLNHETVFRGQKHPKLELQSMALVSHPSAAVGGSQIFSSTQSTNAKDSSNSIVGQVNAASNSSIVKSAMMSDNATASVNKPGSSGSGGSVSGSDSFSGSSGSTAALNHAHHARHHPYHHPAAMMQNGNADANHLVRTLFSNGNAIYNQQMSSKRTEPDRPIGYGAFGVVWSVTDPRNQKRVALKKMPNVFQNLASSKRVFREIQMLSTFHHDNVLGLLDILHPPNQHFFQEIYVLTELMQSDLHKIIVSPQTLTVDHVKVFIYQLLRGLKYLHSANILHRDIKPGNLLVNSNCILKICDFGLARIWDKNEQVNMTHEVVTQYYRAPELLMGARRYTGAVDIWSVGCIFAELLGRRILFQAQGPIEQLNHIVQLLGTPPIEAMKGACENARNHVLRNSSRPYDVNQLAAKFPNAGSDAIKLLQGMLQFDPEKRFSVNDALCSPYLDDGRMRFHSCMCTCCFSVSKRERQYAKELDPDHQRPFNPLWEKDLSRLSIYELREQIFKYVTERKPMYDIPLCINTNSATYHDFQNSSVAQASELPPHPNAWD
ncbi:Nemo-like kinase [Aphelenchoides besseyi]|nr:Nemo-like kinase [Aphelenchoides besseyi]